MPLDHKLDVLIYFDSDQKFANSAKLLLTRDNLHPNSLQPRFLRSRRRTIIVWAVWKWSPPLAVVGRNKKSARPRASIEQCCNSDGSTESVVSYPWIVSYRAISRPLMMDESFTASPRGWRKRIRRVRLDSNQPRCQKLARPVFTCRQIDHGADREGRGDSHGGPGTGDERVYRPYVAVTGPRVNSSRGLSREQLLLSARLSDARL